MNGNFDVPWASGHVNLIFSVFRGPVFLLAAVAATCALSIHAEAQSAVAIPSTTQTQSSTADDPCDGLLATLDRPTVADSPCVVKPGHALAELGYQYGAIKGSDIKSLSTFPQAELRYGLPEGWELKLFPPNYLMSSLRASAGGQISGLGDTSFGVKHEFGTFGGFTLAADAKVTVPTGKGAFSDGGLEGNVQGIVSYNITPQFSVSGLLGVSTLTNRGSNGVVTRFTSMNPDIVATYQINDRLQLYSEVFGNTATAPNLGSNFTFDGGVQFLLTKSIELDVEAGILLFGPQGLQSRYVGFGTGLSF